MGINMKDYILEACVDSVESALAASRGGAVRLELCSNLIIGGTTPGLALFREIRRNTEIPIRALIRPRFGDFCYTDYEFNIIKEEVIAFREAGAEGVVVGILKPDGTLNMNQMSQLKQEAAHMGITLHRAFDVCVDPYQTLEQVKELGINTILTSGQQNNCVAGKELLKELVEKSGDELDIMVGSGVDAEAIRTIHPFVKARAYHMSGKITMNSEMNYRKAGVNMGLPSISEYEIWRTDEAKIKEARELLDELKERD